MRLVLIGIGRLKSGPERDLVERYMARLAAGARTAGLTGVDLRETDESKARRSDDRKSEEARAIRALLPAGATVLALDEHGDPVSSAAFAARIGKARDGGAPALALVIGGPDGLDPGFRQSCAACIAFGAMTWPHQLVRVMAAEQLYRATTILTGHPYHRA